MSTFIDRVGKVVRSEWNSRFHDDDDDVTAEHTGDDADSVSGSSSRRRTPAASTRTSSITDLGGARRVLELSQDATLEEVRASYFRLSKRYHPRTTSGISDQAHAAQTLLVALTDALEMLEEQLLVLPGSKS